MSRFLICGTPRSGTTWVGRILGATRDSAYLHEPDSDQIRPFALKAKLPLGRFPQLLPEDHAPLYETLWERAFASESDPAAPPGKWWRSLRSSGAHHLYAKLSPATVTSSLASPAERTLRLRLACALAVPPETSPTPANLVVKSVHAHFALDWLAARWNLRVVIVQRHPLNVLASWVETFKTVSLPAPPAHPLVQERYARRWGLRLPTTGCSSLEHAAWRVGLLNLALQDVASRHPDWDLVTHEDLCDEPRSAFVTLAGRLGLVWNDAAEELLEQSNKPGTRYRTQRVAAGQRERWRSRLSSAQVDEIRRVLEAFPLSGWPHEDLTVGA